MAAGAAVRTAGSHDGSANRQAGDADVQKATEEQAEGKAEKNELAG
jgi:hypothetical protein